MSLTTEQLQTLKTAIAAETDPTFVAARTANDETGMKNWYNEPSTYVAWKTRVELTDVAANVDGVELVGLTTAKLAAYQALLLAGTVNPSKDRLRAGFDQVFSAAGGNTTRPLLLELWKRIVTRGEKVFASGTGSDATPGQLTREGALSEQDISDALRS
jgi:hypothetical protein